MISSAFIKELLTRDPHRIGNKPIRIRHGLPTKWGWVVWHPDNLILGDYVDIGWSTALFAHYGITIGSDVQIGAHCDVYSYNSEDETRGKVVIGNRARIGAHCVIMPGVVIGTAARIGAFSLVKTDIPPHALAYGVPARVV